MIVYFLVSWRQQLLLGVIIIIAYTAAFPQWFFICWNPSCQHFRNRTCHQHWRNSPTLFKNCCEFFKVPCIGLLQVGRLGQRLNVPTQGRRVAQTGTKPFSLTTPESDPQPGIEPRPHWWEAHMLTTRPTEHPLRLATSRGQIIKTIEFLEPIVKAATSFFLVGVGGVMSFWSS